MRILSSSQILDLWERGARLYPVDRGLQILAAVFPEVPYDTLADWPLGKRNRALLEARSKSFGAVLQGCVSCPQCNEKLEFEVDSKSLASDQALSNESAHRETIRANGGTFRLPTSRDVSVAVLEHDLKAAAVCLLDRCAVDGTTSGDWSEEDIETINEQMAIADPLSEMLLSLHCGGCGHQWEEELDLVGFLCAEIEARARRLLFEIHTLASAYGWTEAQILALSESRRAAYLRMVGS